MKNNIAVLIGLFLLMCAALFYDQIWAAFSGMSALEAMQILATIALRAAVGTAISYAGIGLLKMIKPWMQALRWKRLDARRTQNANRRRRTTTAQISAPKAPHLGNVNRMMVSYLLKQLGTEKQQPTTQRQATREAQPNIRLDM